jgi:hypothetical protein
VAESSGKTDAVRSDIANLTRDEAARARFQARLTARIAGTSQFTQPEKLIADADDPWMRRSILLSSGRITGAFLSQFWLGPTLPERTHSDGEIALIEELSELAAANDQKQMAAGIGNSALVTIEQPEVGLAALRGAAKVWARKGVPDDLRPSLVPVPRLTEIAEEPTLSLSVRSSAVSLIGFAPDASKLLRLFAEKNREQPIRIAAIGALGRQSGVDWHALLDGFASDTPPVRRAIIEAMLGRREMTTTLLDAIEAGRI